MRSTAHLELRRDGAQRGHTLGLALAAAGAYGAALSRAIRETTRKVLSAFPKPIVPILSRSGRTVSAWRYVWCG